MSDRTAGSIYDLGYRHYTGIRLGRRHAIWALYVHRLRASFGIGRPLSSKAFPMGLAIIAFLPAAVQLGIAAAGAGNARVVQPENYYRYVQIVLALFCAAVAPELVGRDQRSGTLALYFSRAIGRWDYAFANFAALISAMLAVTVVPQALLFVGNALAANDFFQYVQDEWRQPPAAIASGLLLSVMVAAIGLAIASQTPRRAYSTVAILAVFVLGSVIGATLLNVSGHDVGRYSLLLSPFHVVDGFALWFFGVSPEARSQLAKADLPGALYAIAAVAISIIALGVLLGRYRRIVA